MTDPSTIDSGDEGHGFSERWLTLREPADHAARNVDVNSALITWASQLDTVEVLELGAGTGSNLRYLIPALGHAQHWQVVDNDTKLLERLPAILRDWATQQGAQCYTDLSGLHIQSRNFSATINTHSLNLSTQLNTLFTHNVDLVTASALLDLSSQAWLDQLCTLCIESNSACLFTLNYNGNIQWQPELATDKQIRTLLNQHQLKDKGFGAALGPDAGHYFAKSLKKQGRTVSTRQSNWTIGKHTQDLQKAIIEGWASACIEQDSKAATTIQNWHKARQEAIEQEQSQLTVGHVDVLSLNN